MDTEKEKFRKDLFEIAKVHAKGKYGGWRALLKLCLTIGFAFFSCCLYQLINPEPNQILNIDFKIPLIICMEIATFMFILIKLGENRAIKEEQEKLKKAFAEMDEYEKRSVEKNA